MAKARALMAACTPESAYGGDLKVCKNLKQPMFLRVCRQTRVEALPMLVFAMATEGRANHTVAVFGGLGGLRTRLQMA